MLLTDSLQRNILKTFSALELACSILINVKEEQIYGVSPFK